MQKIFKFFDKNTSAKFQPFSICILHAKPPAASSTPIHMLNYLFYPLVYYLYCCVFKERRRWDLNNQQNIINVIAIFWNFCLSHINQQLWRHYMRLTLFRLGLFGATHGSGRGWGKKAPLPKICDTICDVSKNWITQALLR